MKTKRRHQRAKTTAGLRQLRQLRPHPQSRPLHRSLKYNNNCRLKLLYFCVEQCGRHALTAKISEESMEKERQVLIAAAEKDARDTTLRADRQKGYLYTSGR